MRTDLIRLASEYIVAEDYRDRQIAELREFLPDPSTLPFPLRVPHGCGHDYRLAWGLLS